MPTLYRIARGAHSDLYAVPRWHWVVMTACLSTLFACGSRGKTAGPDAGTAAHACAAFSVDEIKLGSLGYGSMGGGAVSASCSFDGQSIWIASESSVSGQWESSITRIGCDGTVLVPPTVLWKRHGFPTIASSSDSTIVIDHGLDADAGPVFYRLYSQTGQVMMADSEIVLNGTVPDQTTLSWVVVAGLPAGGFLLNLFLAGVGSVDPGYAALEALNADGTPASDLLVGESFPPSDQYAGPFGWAPIVNRDDQAEVAWLGPPYSRDTGGSGSCGKITGATVSLGSHLVLDTPTVLESSDACGYQLAAEPNSAGHTFMGYLRPNPPGSGIHTAYLRAIDDDSPNAQEIQISETDGTLGSIAAGTAGGVLVGWDWNNTVAHGFDYDGHSWTLRAPQQIITVPDNISGSPGILGLKHVSGDTYFVLYAEEISVSTAHGPDIEEPLFGRFFTLN